MSDQIPDADRDDVDPRPQVESLEEEVVDLAPMRNLDGAYSDEPADPAFQAVIEAGGGVAEGFEQAEALLVEHASEGDLDGTKRVLLDAAEPEKEPDPGIYGEADEEHVSERID